MIDPPVAIAPIRNGTVVGLNTSGLELTRADLRAWLSDLDRAVQRERGPGGRRALIAWTEADRAEVERAVVLVEALLAVRGVRESVYSRIAAGLALAAQFGQVRIEIARSDPERPTFEARLIGPRGWRTIVANVSASEARHQAWATAQVLGVKVEDRFIGHAVPPLERPAT